MLRERFSESRDEKLIGAFTYGQAWANAENLVRQWKQVGLNPGNRIVLSLKNDPAYLICYLACIAGGFTACPISPVLNAETRKKMIGMIKPALVFREPPGFDYGIDPSIPGKIPQSEIFAVIFTSGTTAEPKGICFSLDGALGIAGAFAKHSGMDASTQMHHVLPMAYNAGFINSMMAPMTVGGSIVGCQQFSALQAAEFKWRGNFIVITPTIASALCRYVKDVSGARAEISRYRAIHCTAGQLTKGLRERFLDTFQVPLQDCYGITELGGPLTLQTREDAFTEDNCGIPIPGVAFRFLPAWQDSDGGYGGADELWVESPWAMLGYLTEDGLEVPTKWNGAFPTGDAGEFHGKLKITGRKKDLIVRGDVNVSPLAVENVVSQIEGVAEVSVVGARDEFWGEVVVACVIPRVQDVHELQKRIHAECIEHLSVNERPDRIVILHEFPRANGKVQKHILKRFAENLGD